MNRNYSIEVKGIGEIPFYFLIFRYAVGFIGMFIYFGVLCSVFIKFLLIMMG